MRTRILSVAFAIAVALVWSGQAGADMIVWSDNFDGGGGGVGWTQWKTAPQNIGGVDYYYPTDWEMGSMSNQGDPTKPSGAYSSPNCYKTNLDGPTEVWAPFTTPGKVIELYTPELDLTALIDAQFSFVDYMIVESGVDTSGLYDYCGLEVVDSDGNNLVWLDKPIKDNNTSWQTGNSYSLDAYVGQKVKIGFALYVDNMVPSWGWAIDDVKLTTSVPEPMTLALLGSGVVLLLRRRRG